MPAAVRLPAGWRRSIRGLSRQKRVRHVVFMKPGLGCVPIDDRPLEFGLERLAVDLDSV